MDSLVEEIKEV